MPANKKAAFIKVGNFSHANDSLLKELIKCFPDFHFDVIDLIPYKNRIEIFLALFHCLREYGGDIVFGKKTLGGIYDRTSYIFKKRRKLILSILAKNNYDFTFQTQSLFDASMPGIPHFLYSDHTHLANLQYPGFDRRLLLNSQYIEYEKQIYQNATLNFTMSSNISESLVEDYSCSPDKVACVYCGSNVQVAENEYFDNSRYSKKNILFVGLDWQRKGGPTLAEAFRTVLLTYPDATLTIVGCKPELDLPNCNITGKVDLFEVKKHFKQASVFCLPTTLEPFGIVFLEAMAHKLPVIATNIGAIPDFIHEAKNGYLVVPNDSQQLSRALIKLLASQNDCRAFGEYGHRLFWDRYTWEKTGIRMRDHILRFIG
jgi:glycosyltransferase involved in cell wall biosynthesis